MTHVRVVWSSKSDIDACDPGTSERPSLAELNLPWSHIDCAMCIRSSAFRQLIGSESGPLAAIVATFWDAVFGERRP